MDGEEEEEEEMEGEGKMGVVHQREYSVVVGMAVCWDYSVVYPHLQVAALDKIVYWQQLAVVGHEEVLAIPYFVKNCSDKGHQYVGFLERQEIAVADLDYEIVAWV